MFQTRAMKTSDIHYITKTVVRIWVNDKRNASLDKRLLEKKLNNFFKKSEITIVYKNTDYDYIVGFFIYTYVSPHSVIVHCLYVREFYRDLGLMTAFLRKLSQKGITIVGYDLNFKDEDIFLKVAKRFFKQIENLTINNR